MPTDVQLPDGLTIRSAVREDARSVFDLLAAHERAAQGEADTTLEDILSDWARPSFDLDADSIVVSDGERVVAEAEVYKGRRAEVMVHPDEWGRGIGTWLLGWVERRARAAGGTLVGQTVPDTLTTAVELFRRHGYEPLWTSWILEIELTEPPNEPELPSGYALRPYVSGDDDRAVYEVTERAFSEWPGRDATSFEDWRASAIDRDDFDPELTFLIDRDGEPVGIARCIDADGQGWVQAMAVAREHRGAGLGRALLQRSFVEFHRRGRSVVQLNTDSRTGALGLYEHVGMRVVRSYTHHAKEL
ncbi:MAG: GNAT family N-acetyltransferase [Actinobacteria bacterium]|nr:GNAT family N-acetyltransferase [Actinomycetota bacterium]